jgi:hypothetical protein
MMRLHEGRRAQQNGPAGDLNYDNYANILPPFTFFEKSNSLPNKGIIIIHVCGFYVSPVKITRSKV